MTKVAELYGLPTFVSAKWKNVVELQQCPFLNRKCLKNRKSEADLDDWHLHHDLRAKDSAASHDLSVPALGAQPDFCGLRSPPDAS